MRSAPGLKTVISPSGSVAMIETWVEASSRALSRALTCISSASVRRRSANKPICSPSVVIACNSGSSRLSASRESNVITPRIGPVSLAMIGKLNALRKTHANGEFSAHRFDRLVLASSRQSRPSSPRTRHARSSRPPGETPVSPRIARPIPGQPAARSTVSPWPATRLPGDRPSSTRPRQNPASRPTVESKLGIASSRRLHPARTCIVAC